MPDTTRRRRPPFQAPEFIITETAELVIWAYCQLRQFIERPTAFRGRDLQEWRAGSARVRTVLNDPEGIFWLVREIERLHGVPVGIDSRDQPDRIPFSEAVELLKAMLEYTRPAETFHRLGYSATWCTRHKYAFRKRISKYRDPQMWKLLWGFHDVFAVSYSRLLGTGFFLYAPNTQYGQAFAPAVVDSLASETLSEHHKFQLFHASPKLQTALASSLLSMLWGGSVFEMLHHKWSRIRHMTKREAARWWQETYPSHRRQGPARVSTQLDRCATVSKIARFGLASPTEHDALELAGLSAIEQIAMIHSEKLVRTGAVERFLHS